MKTLTKVIFKNAKPDIKNLNILSILSFIIVFLFLAGVMSVSSYIVTKELLKINQSYAFINILLLMNFIVLFGKSIFESLNVLYFSKDLKILLRMPIKSKDILHAKLIKMIVSEYQMETIMLAIPMIVFGILTKVNFTFYLYMIIILIVLPIIPIMITSLVISVIMRFTNFIKNKNKVLYITVVFSIILLEIISMNFKTTRNNTNSSFQDILLQTNGLAENIANQFVLVKPIMNTLLNYNNIEGIKNLILYLLESIICYISILMCMSRIYLKGAIGTTINSTMLNINQTKKVGFKDFKQRRIGEAYIFKELKILARTPIFNIQCLIMPIIYPILILAIIVFLIGFTKKIGIDISIILYKILKGTMGQVVVLAIGQTFYMLNFNSIIAISKESKSYKLIKYIPVSLKKQFNMKMYIGIIINIISSILLTILYYLIIYNPIMSLTMFIGLLGLNIIGEKFKLLIDIRNPKINWDNEYTMMKQNTNVMFELFYTLIIIGALVIISNIIKSTELFWCATIIMLIITNSIMDRYIVKNQSLI